MSHELRRTKKLREMFRRFHSSGRRKSEHDGEEKSLRIEPSTPPKPSAKTTQPAQHSPADGKKASKSRDNSLDCEPSVRQQDEQEMSAEQKSASERKRHSIRVKYGISEKDEEYYRRTTEDQEQFENVNAVARPAATKMRTHKLKWKKDKGKKTSKVSSCDDDKEESSPELSDEMTEETSDPGSRENDKIAEIKRRAGLSKQSAEVGLSAETLTETRLLIIRIEELELANKRLALQMKRLRKRLRKKDKKIEELMTLNSFLKKSSAAEEQKEEEKPTPQQEAIALRGLEIIQRNHLLEDTTHNTERTMLCDFFEAAELKPTHTIVTIIDKALSYAIDVILMRPDMFDDFVDNELRLFLLDTTKAKHILLDVMLLHPEFVPRAWGGDVLMKRKQQAIIDSELNRKVNVTEDRTIREDDIIEVVPHKARTPTAQSSPHKLYKSPTGKVEKREKKSSSEAIVGKKDDGKNVAKAGQAAIPIKKIESKEEKKATEPSPQKKLTPAQPPPAPVQKKSPTHNGGHTGGKSTTPPGKAAEKVVNGKKTPSPAAKPPVKNH